MDIEPLPLFYNLLLAYAIVVIICVSVVGIIKLCKFGNCNPTLRGENTKQYRKLIKLMKRLNFSTGLVDDSYVALTALFTYISLVEKDDPCLVSSILKSISNIIGVKETKSWMFRNHIRADIGDKGC